MSKAWIPILRSQDISGASFYLDPVKVKAALKANGGTLFAVQGKWNGDAVTDATKLTAQSIKVSATDTDFNFAIFFPDKANGGKLKDATRAYMNRAEAVGAQSVYLKQGDALPAFDATMYVLVPAPQ